MVVDTRQLTKDFFSKYSIQKVASGKIFIAAYETPEDIFYVESGRIRQFDININGTESVLNIYASGAFFSIVWLLTEQENRYFFSALSDTVLYRAPKEDVLKFLNSNPTVAMDLLTRLAQGIDGLLFRMSAQLQGTITNRLITEMVIEARRFSEKINGGETQINISVNELAARSGMARETVSRQLKSLKLRGLIQKDKNVILIPDLRKLENFIGNQ